MGLPALLATPIGASLVGGVFKMGEELIDRLFPDKVAQAADRARAEAELFKLTQSGKLEEAKVQLSAIIAEAQSSDPWTSRARPSFLYVMYVMILWAIPMGIISAFWPEHAKAIAEGTKAWLGAIPEALWWLFGSGYLGYTVTRSVFDKPKVKK